MKKIFLGGLHMKKLVSLLLIVVMVLSIFTIVPSSVGAASSSQVSVQADNGLYVKAGNNVHEVKKGDLFNYTYYLTLDDTVKISSLDINVFYDTDGLDLVPFVDSYGDVDMEKHFPIIYGGCVHNFDIDGEIYFNYSNIKGVRFTNDAVIFTAQFKVTADKGTYEISDKIVTLADSDMNKIVYDKTVIQKIFTNKVEVTDIKSVEQTDNSDVQIPSLPDEYDKARVVVDGTNYNLKKGDIITYVYTMNVDDALRISSLDINVFYDTEGLDLEPYKDEYGDVDMEKHFPIIHGGCVHNFGIDGEIYFNYSNIKGVKFTNDAVVFTAQFKVTAEKGVFNINSKVVTLADSDMNKIVYRENVINPDVYDVKTKVTANTSSDIEPPEKNVIIDVDGKKYAACKDVVFTYYYTMSVDEALKISSLDINVFYDTEGLDVLPYKNQYGEIEIEKHLPVLHAGAVENFAIDGAIYFNYSSVKGMRLLNDAVVFTTQFKVKEDEGTYSINSKIVTLADSDMNKIVFDKKVLKPDVFKATTSIADKTPTGGDTEDKPDETTSDVTEATHTYTVAGDINLCGTGWDPKNAANDLTVDEKTGLWSITYTNVAEGNYEYKIVQDHSWDESFNEEGNELGGNNATFDVEVDGSKVKIYFDGKKCWDEVEAPTQVGTMTIYFRNNLNLKDLRAFYWDSSVEENMYWPGKLMEYYDNDGVYDYYTITVPDDIKGIIFNGVDKVTNENIQTFTISDSEDGDCYYIKEITLGNHFDTAKNHITEFFPEDTDKTEDKTDNTQNTEPAPKDVFVKMDGELYKVNKGDVITYQYILNVDNGVKISSLDINTFYDAEGLELVKYVDSYGDDDVKKHFPKIYNSVVHNFGIEGEIYYNYSNIYGVRLENDAVMFEGQFRVTADEGTYDIFTNIVTLADTDLNKIVYNNKVIKDIVTKKEVLVGRIPYDPNCKPEGLYVKIGDTYHEVVKNEEYEFTYYLQVEDKRVGTIDARVEYDQNGLEFVPTLDEYGDYDSPEMFPVLRDPVFNDTIEGKLFFNYININGRNFGGNNKVLFKGNFKVTADQGVYEIKPYIFCLADTDLGIIVDEGTVYGEFTERVEFKQAYKKGDVNGDDKINIFDMTEIQLYVAEFEQLDETQLKAADVNGDGKVNIFDATTIALFVAEIIPSLK